MREERREKRDTDVVSSIINLQNSGSGCLIQGYQDSETRSLPQLGLCSRLSLQIRFILSGQLLQVEEERSRGSSQLPFLLSEPPKWEKGWAVDHDGILFSTSWKIQLENPREGSRLARLRFNGCFWTNQGPVPGRRGGC